MQRIRLLTSVAGGVIEGNPGDEVEVAPDVAEAWCEAGYAERVATPAGHDHSASPAGELDSPPLGERAVVTPRGQRAVKR